MLATEKMWSVLALMAALGLGAGCDNGTSSDDDVVVYSYAIDEIAPGLFGNLSPTMTVNEWVYAATRGQTYESMTANGAKLYKDENLKTPFTGADIVNEDTVVYCNFSLNGQGKKTGEITGTVTLTDIPHLATTKVYMSCFRFGDSKWWYINRKIDISEVTGTSEMLNWSLPVYESVGFDKESTFEIIVLSGDSIRSYSVPVPDRKIISNANANIGDLGTVSLKGVTLSGIITVTYNGELVPYVEVIANFDGWGTLGSTGLYMPEPNTPWSVTFGPNPNDHIGVEFRVTGYTGRNGTFIFQKYAIPEPLVYIDDNQSVSGIILNVDDN